MKDVSCYKCNGFGSDGFNLWLRLRVLPDRCENYYKKLELAIGSWIVGPILMHYILLYLPYRHNVNSNIKRCNCVDSGHFEL